MEMEQCELCCDAQSARGFWRRLLLGLQRLGQRLARWQQLAEQRRQLREMDDHQLKDIGLSRADVERIAGRRWFWEDPVGRGEQLDERYRRGGR